MTPGGACRAVALILLALAGRAAAQDATATADELAVVEARFGFRIVRPGAQWIAHSEEAGADDDAYALTLYERDTPYLPSVVIHVAPHDGAATSEDVRAAAAASLSTSGGAVLEQGASELAGRPAASLRCRAEGTDGSVYEAELHYLVAPPFIYALQCNWVGGAPRPDAVFDPLIASFELFTPELPERDEAAEALEALAARCGSELNWAADWADAAARAKAENKPLCVVFQHYAGLDLPHTIASGALMDSDLVALLARHVIALKLRIDDPAPFRAADAWGLGPSSWGGSIFFVSAEGEMLEELGVPNAFLVADAARRVLARSGTPLDLPRDVLLRLQRRGAEALDDIAAARRGADASQRGADAARRGVGAAHLADLDVEEGVLRMRLGDTTAAQELLERALAVAPEGARAPEALFWLGALEMLSKGYPQGMERWRLLVAKQPENRWAWKAAANLTPQGSFVNGGERLDWPDADTFAAVRRPKLARLAGGQVERARRDAIAWLLAAQGDDGAWLAPMDAFGVQHSGYTFAITALCGSSLLPFAERDAAVKQAVLRAEAYLLSVHAAGGFAVGDNLAGVYSIWGRVYALRFLAQCRGARIGGGPGLMTALDDLLQSVLESQHAGGGWPYISFEGRAGSAGFDPSTSFLTAGVLLALHDVRAAGTAVAQASFDRAHAFLKVMRHADGSFRYLRDAPEASGNPEAAGRGPVCALALLRGGAGSVDELAVSLARFDEQRPALKREWGKDTCHTGPQGQGAHYLLFDWAFAAEAVRELPRTRQATFRRALLQDILDVRDEEGAYCDMPALGRAYGTAMALSAFRSLGDS